MQRDIIGDDPLTEKVEPCEDAEFALLISNKGYGDATNLKLTTHQPEIIDNQKGLLIDFEIISGQLNGGEKTPALGGDVVTDFGTVGAMSSSYAQWWLRSSLLGHFTSYQTEYTNLTSYGNEELSLIDTVMVHELIRSVDVMGDLKGFVVNDCVDADDLPDHIYLSDGTVDTVAIASNMQMKKISAQGIFRS